MHGADTVQADNPIQQGLSLHLENDEPELNVMLGVSRGFAGFQHMKASQHTSNYQPLVHTGRSTRSGSS